MIEQRLKDSGVKLVSVVPDGTDRIRIFLPGVTDPERITAIFARKVKVSFRLIDTSMPPEQAQSGTPPEGTEVLLGFKDKRPYLVAKDSVLDGDDINYAASRLCGRHQGPGRLVPLQRTRHPAPRPCHGRERRKSPSPSCSTTR